MGVGGDHEVEIQQPACWALGHTCYEPDPLSFWSWIPREILKVAPSGARARTLSPWEAKSERGFLPISELIELIPGPP